MQGVGKDTRGVLTGATNCPWDLDQEFVEDLLNEYIPLPEREARQIMFKIHIGSTPNELTDQDYAIMADKTDGFSGSDAVCCTGCMWNRYELCNCDTF